MKPAKGQSGIPWNAIRVATAAFLLAAAACSGNASVLPQAHDLTTARPAAANPCRFTGAWHFHGACTVFVMGNAGPKVSLESYKGLTLDEHFPKNYAPDNTRFVSGDGTNRQDITGTIGDHPFPVYGSIPCVSLGGKDQSCPGKAVLYNAIRNEGSHVVYLNTTPKFTIASTRAFPGSKCQEMLLHSNGQSLVWMRLPAYGTPQSGAVTFEPIDLILDVGAKTTGVFGFACY